jgi:ATP-dependent Clp protease protease subunit
MAVLKIYNDIADEESKNMKLWFTGVDSTCFKDIDEFLASVSEEDKTIDLRLNCRGGSVSEGWAIYDKLRDSGKEIAVTVEGICASMATVLLLSAPKGKRTAMPNAELLIHDPYIPEYTLEDAYRAEDLRAIADSLEADTNKLLDLYVERTGADRAELQAIMDEDKRMSVSEAKRLGFIDEIKVPSTAKESNNSNFKNMKEKVTVGKGWLDRILAKAGYAKMEDVPEVVNMELSTADGATLTIEREEGDPQVGDAASPDGEHVMPDGSTIVVAGGVITEIRPAEEEEGDEDKDARIAELERQLEEARAQAKSANDLKILNAVKMAGGEKFLAKHCSSYKVQGRAQTQTHKEFNEGGDESPLAKELRERREGKYKKGK